MVIESRENLIQEQSMSRIYSVFPSSWEYSMSKISFIPIEFQSDVSPGTGGMIRHPDMKYAY